MTISQSSHHYKPLFWWLGTTYKIINRYEYDAFGNEINSAVFGGVYNPFRYTGQYLDSETGLYYLRARYYDSSNGRFTQEDSYLGDENNPLTLNLYAYCANSPVMFSDSSGYFGTPIQWAMAAVGAIAEWYFGDYVARRLGYASGWKY